MNKILNVIISTKTTIVLFVVFAFMMARATFIENDFGTQTAKSEIYNSFFFEFIMLLLAINFIGNIKRYNLLKKEKIGLLTFHLAFIIILLGSFFTRYIGFEGTIQLRKNEIKNYIKSNENFLHISINDGVKQRDYEKAFLLSKKSKMNFSKKITFLEKEVNVKLVNFIPQAEKNLEEDKVNGKKILNLIILSPQGEKKDLFLQENDVKNIDNIFSISLNNNIRKDINIYFNDDNLPIINSPSGLGIFDMITSRTDTLIPHETKIFEKKIYLFGGYKLVLKSYSDKGRINYISSEDKQNPDLLIFEIYSNSNTPSQLLEIAANETNNWTIIDNLNVNIYYAPKIIYLPFNIKLDNFTLETYPGSKSPKSYESNVTIIENNTEILKTKIFMNNTLKYKGYKFFQSSYDTDKKGSILSVNYDTLGTFTTYFGYILMTIGMIITLFSKNRFGNLVRNISNNKNLLLIILFLISFNIKSEEKKLEDVTIDKKHSENFSSILIQDPQGRIKPINTLSLEVLRKIYGKEKYQTLDANQVFLSMIFDPEFWANQNIIKLKNKDLAKEINKEKSDYLSFNDFFDSSFNYKLLDKVNKAYMKPEKDRDELDKNIIKTDEKLNILFSVFNKSFLNIFPLKNDENNAWYSSKNIKLFHKEDSLFVSSIENYYISEIEKIKKNNSDYKMADSIVGYIKLYQEKKSDPNILPSKSKIKAEIYYNKASIFQKLYQWYTFLGLLSLILFFLMIFNSKRVYNILFNLTKICFIILFSYHTFGLILRWYISGHAPWSNGYESMIYIAWGIGLFGIGFSHKSKILIPASLIMSGITLFVSKLNLFDPQITNLVPVLNSYWLIIHVAVITISYSFFAISTIISFIVLSIMIFKTKNNNLKLNSIIKEFTSINEISLIVGLFFLSIGTFLGGVWANESWGRYWGWDPKETWALISIIIYSIVIHLRLIPKLRNGWLFNLSTIIAFFSILMTYFGVNYYLSGLHSYAKGDSIPIPKFIYYYIFAVIVISVTSYFKNKKNNES